MAAIFVPQSNGSKLVRKVEEAESELRESMTWNIKVIEQSGTPLALMFTPKFQMELGCPLASACVLCNNTAIQCHICATE